MYREYRGWCGENLYIYMESFFALPLNKCTHTFLPSALSPSLSLSLYVYNQIIYQHTHTQPALLYTHLHHVKFSH